MKWIFAFAVILSFFAAFVDLTIMKTFPCHESEYENLECTINKVALEGCKKDNKAGQDCKLRRDQNASIEIDFTPNFEGNDVKLEIFALLAGREAPWAGFDTNACNHMTCPVVKDQVNKYSYGITVSNAYPTGTFTVRFVTKQSDDVKCCFISRISIYK